ncbi:hypothetical protein FPANT_3434 [Fusarium pseudoanthophilum]|uniref:RING-type domain-containing protein n=1 Tax=Fusarium pseudoanthophilum TaxID=48495 RepID=A0A8H5PMF2_9HYPO|nr:hypothetical protein FPANT_3434 [Fusarium pseudoanthophilum]
MPTMNPAMNHGTIIDAIDSDIVPITDIYWPSFKKEVANDPQQLRPIDLTCTICTEQMSTQGSGRGSIHWIPKQGRQISHDAQILPCGHMVGGCCLMNWLESQFERFQGREYYSCPVCNTEIMNHPECGHLCHGQRIPHLIADYSNVPLVLSEGGFIHARCAGCEIQHTFSEMTQYTGIYKWEDEVESTNQYITLGFLDARPGGFLYMDGSKDPKRPLCERVRRLRTPEELKTIWEAYRQVWVLKFKTFWISHDLSNVTLCLYLMKTVNQLPETSQTKAQSIFRRVFSWGSST